MTFVSGVLAGLMLCTSAGVFLAFMPFLAALWLRRVDDMRRDHGHRWPLRGLGGGLIVALCLTPLFLADPHFVPPVHSSTLNTRELRGIAAMLSVTLGSAPPAEPVHLVRHSADFLPRMISLWGIGRVREMLVLFVAPLVGFVLVPLYTANGNLLVVSSALVIDRDDCSGR